MKKIVSRVLYSFPIGISCSVGISLFLSLLFGEGKYYPFAASLVFFTGSEVKAMLLQTMLSGILGGVFGGMSFIWEIERWSILKQTAVYFLSVSIPMMGISYLLYWMEHSLNGFLLYFLIFVMVFFVVWLFNFAIYWFKVR
ncbi:MAG: DUF3021 domain-containing protein, partial [Oribacterium parvum]|nr:DUF3021 domain-containing protein [Oribacterium parvum]